MQEVKLAIEGGVGGPTWQAPPMVELAVADTRGFVQYTLVKVGGRASARLCEACEACGDAALPLAAGGLLGAPRGLRAMVMDWMMDEIGSLLFCTAGAVWRQSSLLSH